MIWRSIRGGAGTLFASLIAGFAVGGVGARLFMRVVAVATPPATGRTTEAWATTGQITPEGTMVRLLGFLTPLQVKHDQR